VIDQNHASSGREDSFWRWRPQGREFWPIWPNSRPFIAQGLRNVQGMSGAGRRRCVGRAPRVQSEDGGGSVRLFCSRVNAFLGARPSWARSQRQGRSVEAIRKMVRWEDFRADIEAVTETKPEERRSKAGRKPYDTILKFKIVVLRKRKAKIETTAKRIAIITVTVRPSRENHQPFSALWRFE
jgi:hypothetical protein